MFDLGGGELLLIIVFVLIFFGPKKLPEFAQSMGRGMREFRKAQQEFSQHINTAFEEEQRKNARGPEVPPLPNTTPRSRVPVEAYQVPGETPPPAEPAAESYPPADLPADPSGAGTRPPEKADDAGDAPRR